MTAAGGIFLTETAGDMVLSQIATSDALLGRIELTSTGGGILNGNTDGSPNIVIDSPIGLILLSASGDIGASNPLVYDALDAALRVTSQGSVYVRSRRGIVLDLIAARERAVLEAENGHIQQTVTGSIEASMVELFAESGGIGMKDQRVVVSAARVNALAYGDIFLEIQEGMCSLTTSRALRELSMSIDLAPLISCWPASRRRTESSEGWRQAGRFLSSPLVWV